MLFSLRLLVQRKSIKLDVQIVDIYNIFFHNGSE